MSKTRQYRLTARKVHPPELEQLGQVQAGAVTLGQWDTRPEAEDAMARYTAANPGLYAADGAGARLVVTEV